MGDGLILLDDFLLVSAVGAITGAGVVTGLLFAFSNFVMRALEGLPAEQGMFAMQQINREIINPVFLVFFLGTPLLCLVVAMGAIAADRSTATIPLLAGALLYLVGPFGVTVLFNVPLNNGLASGDPSEAQTLWPMYRTVWQRWNHVRTFLGILSVVFLAFGLAWSHSS